MSEIDIINSIASEPTTPRPTPYTSTTTLILGMMKERKSRQSLRSSKSSGRKSTTRIKSIWTGI